MSGWTDLERERRIAHLRVEHLWLRLKTEFQFADFLCAANPDAAGEWRERIRAASGRVGARVGQTGLAETEATVLEAERELAPLAAAARGYTIHLVGHAHIDMNWMWSWPETVACTHDSFATVLRLMDETPGFRFSQSQASVYELVAEHYPAMIERIAARVREGRWEVVASHWVETDKNLVSGESLCRHLLLTRAYLRDLFGLAPEDVPVDWSPDTFGHPATMPTYLAQGGVRYLYLHRPGPDPSRAEAFWWEGPDGARVLVRNDMRRGYNGTIDANLAIHLRAFHADTKLPFCMYVYGVGDHGGGPTRRDLAMAREMGGWPVFPRLEFSTARAFFERLEREGGGLPVVRGDLNPEFTGCYTTQSLIKRANRLAECRLADAETAALWDWTARGAAYPARRLAEAWRKTLFSHFHDILPGSCVHDARTYSHGLFQQVAATTATVESSAWRALAADVDTSAFGPVPPRDLPPSALQDAVGGGAGIRAAEGAMSAAEQGDGGPVRPFVVFNPTGVARREVVEATVWDNEPPGSPFRHQDRRFEARTFDGAWLPAQTLAKGQEWGHHYQRLAAPVDVPAFGYAALAFVEAGDPPAPPPAARARAHKAPHACSYSCVERDRLGLENGVLRVELDPRTGHVRSLADARTGTEWLRPDAAGGLGLEYGVERPGRMNAWLIEHTGPVERTAAARVRYLHEGPHVAAIECEVRIRESTFHVTYELRAGEPRLLVRIRGEWFQRGTAETGAPNLRLAIPLALEGARVTCEVPFGSRRHETTRDEEVPALQWARVDGRLGDAAGGLLVANDGKSGHALEGSVLRVNLIRSSHNPDPLPEIGRHDVAFALVPFAGTMSDAEATGHARALNHPLKTVGTGVHAGRLPPGGAWLAVKPETVVVQALKLAESGDRALVRLVETAGRATEARLRWDPRLAGAVVAAGETDLLERPRAPSSARVADGEVIVRVPAHGIASVAVTLAPAGGGTP